jgi:signal transduction histidine kinase
MRSKNRKINNGTRIMELKSRNLLIYGLLLGVWLLLVVWLAAEHLRVREVARAALVNRAKDISTTLGIVLRSQRRFGGVVSKERLEASLTELVRQDKTELKGIALLNTAGAMVASAGSGFDLQTRGSPGTTEHWDAQTVTLMNPVDLGTNLTYDIEGTNLPIILSRQDFTNRLAPNHPPGPRREPPPPDENPADSPPGVSEMPHPPPSENETNRMRFGRARFGRPRWMSEEEYQALREKQGVHSFVIVMSTQPLHAALNQDLWLRAIIALLATISLAGSGFFWGNLTRSSELQIRLVRASEMNSHLREMNLAAAGLAHETRNPLNIIRGMAQMISKRTDVPAELQGKVRAIVDETDKVTAQLNEFINYSRPRELRRANLALNSVVTEVVRALAYDIDEKKVRFETGGDTLTVEADEQMLRQALFNLSLNAIQAVSPNGRVRIVTQKTGATEAPERRQEIFKPYFTTNQQGTGLGLAVVHQIVLAHGWEIECLPNDAKGAVFRITHLKVAG